VALLTSGAGLLILLLYFPGGLVQLLYGVRDLAFAGLARRLDAAPAPARTPTPAAPTDAEPAAAPGVLRVRERERTAAEGEAGEGDPALRLEGVTVRFGARTVVDRVDLDVGRGEVVGLIGANGAGKSTLMNAVGGFVPSRGTIEVLGRDVQGLAPHRRAGLGLGRSFQDAALFADLTVRETVQTALETRARAAFVAVALGLPRARRRERAKRAQADEILAFLGLGPYAERFVSELSTGMRRIVELACLLAVDARVLCLDEPTAGIAQREAEAFGPLLLALRTELDASMLVIEHDMPLVMSISDRIWCLEAGRVISSGPPAAVRADPRVVASYLGTDEHAIARSGSIAAEAEPSTPERSPA
jgi:ABC-type branched-subunit amino acid transport system ATPase component